ncbi:MAG: hypothetical protein COA79_13735 [Planctomycetota bacterium]|nr:MAG: hypothetical protein COA79_13735 [Planctomycetota bacterium]
MNQVEKIDNFEVVTLKNDICQIKIVPELGMKIISLKNEKSSREWMWSAKNPNQIFENDPLDPFELSPLIGADECLPTIDPCEINGVEMGDHGLVWSKKCDYSLNEKEIICTADLEQIKMKFKRTISLSGPAIQFKYELQNMSSNKQPYIWAFHPLFNIQEHDHWSYDGVWGSFLCTSSKNIQGVSRGSNIRVNDLKGFLKMNIRNGEKDNYFIKGFFTNDSQTMIEIKNKDTNDSLIFDYKNIPFTGIWLTRGGWNNYHHIVIEPSNACYESLSEVSVDSEETSTLQPHETREWEFSIKLSN